MDTFHLHCSVLNMPKIMKRTVSHHLISLILHLSVFMSAINYVYFAFTAL